MYTSIFLKEDQARCDALGKEKGRKYKYDGGTCVLVSCGPQEEWNKDHTRCVQKGKKESTGCGCSCKKSKITEEEVDTKQVIRDLIKTEWSGSNEEQLKAVELMKGLALSDDPISNKFMQALDRATSEMEKTWEQDLKEAYGDYKNYASGNYRIEMDWKRGSMMVSDRRTGEELFDLTGREFQNAFGGTDPDDFDPDQTIAFLHKKRYL